MTLCNMSIEGGARAGLVAPDDVTFDYVRDTDHAPKGDEWDAAVAFWRTLPTDEGATFDKEVVLDASSITPHVTWGTNPAQVTPIAGSVPDPADMADPGDREAAERALAYMGLEAGTPMRQIKVDTVFLGSCTNSRIEDFRSAAAVLEGRSVHPACVPWPSRARTGSRRRPRPRAWTKCSRLRASSGASLAVRCVWP